MRVDIGVDITADANTPNGEVVLAFDKFLFVKQPPMDANGTPKYGTALIFAPDSKTAAIVTKAFGAVSLERWQNADLWKGLQRDKRSLRKGEEMLTKEGNVRNGFAGKLVLVAKSDVRPYIADANGNPVTTEEESPLYAGCKVYAMVDIYAHEVKGVRGVYTTLKGLQFAGDGERLGGGWKPTVDDFKPLAGAAKGAKDAKATAEDVFS